MAHRHPSNVAESATNTPASEATAFALAGTADAPMRTFAAALNNGDTCPVHASNGTDWQDFVGTYNAGTLAQTTLLDSSTGAWVDWSAGGEVALEIAWLGATGEETEAHTVDATKHLPASPMLGQMVVQSSTGPIWVDYADALTNTVAPVVSGSTGYSNELSCTTGTWSGFGAISYAYQWYADAVILSGETTNTYTTAFSDVGAEITCIVTATDTLTSASANSNGITVTDSPLHTSEFYAPLTDSLILTRGTGDPTYARATTAWEFDNEGKLILVPSGAARFGGARMVRNFFAGNTDDASGANWTKAGGITADAGGLLTSTITQANSIYNTTSISAVSGRTYVCTFTGKSGSKRYFQIAIPTAIFGSAGRANFDLTAGTVETCTAGITGGITSLGGGEYRCYAIFTAAATINNPVYFSIQDTASAGYYANSTAGTITVKNFQIEDVSGQSDTSASEYVSVGVLSAPYHGAGVDGVKWFDTNKAGTALSESSLLGYHAEGARTNNLLYSRDLTNAAWVKTNVTAAKTATGIDNVANSASTLTAGAADATILQTLTLAAAARSSSAYVKRRTGTGNVYFTRDGGTTWTDITASVGASWTRVKIENSSVLNPSIGFKLATSGDEIDVDCVQDEAGASASSPIITTTAAITRNTDALTYQKASNWLDASGTALVSVKLDSSKDLGAANRFIDCSYAQGIFRRPGYASTITGISDGTTYTNSATISDLSTAYRKRALSWSSATSHFRLAADGTVVIDVATYDGAFGAGPTAIGTSLYGYIKQVYIWQSALSNADLQVVTTP